MCSVRDRLDCFSIPKSYTLPVPVSTQNLGPDGVFFKATRGAQNEVLARPLLTRCHNTGTMKTNYRKLCTIAKRNIDTGNSCFIDTLKGDSMKLALRLSLLTLVVLGAGCVQTKVTGFRDPAFRDITYHDVVVMTRSGDLTYDKMTESCFVQSLSRQKVHIRPSMDFFPPTREIGEKEAIQKLQAENIEALLIVSLTSRSVGTQFIQGTSHAFPQEKYTVRLIDVKSGSVAWMASSASFGDEFSSTRDLVGSLALETTAALIKEGLVGPTRR
jgi:hypothetical protein